MEPSYTYALRKCSVAIVQDLDPVYVLDYFVSDGWFTENDCELILNESTTKLKARKFLDILKKRPTGAFDSFVKALRDVAPYLADNLLEQTKSYTPTRRRQHSLSDLRNAFIDGCVPDLPPYHASRLPLVEELTQCFQNLASRFQPSTRTSVTLSMDTLSESTVPKFETKSSNVPVHHPAPTNSWLLIHGIAGIGKTTLCSTVLYQHPELLTTYFPGGMVWMEVGPLTVSSPGRRDSGTSGRAVMVTQRVTEILHQLDTRLLSQLDNTDDIPRGSIYPTGVTTGSARNMLSDASERLRRTLIRLQRRDSMSFDEEGFSPIPIQLIILDDVWDEEVITALVDKPAAFVVISRDSEILQRVRTQVEKFHLCENLSTEEAAALLSKYSGHPPSFFLPSTNRIEDETQKSLQLACQLTRGSPFAVSLLGYLLKERENLSDYFCAVQAWGVQFLDWVELTRQTAYNYDSVYRAFQASVTRLNREHQSFYDRLVVLDSQFSLTTSVAAVLWSVSDEVALKALRQMTRFSLAISKWDQSQWVFRFDPLLLDTLRASVLLDKQMEYHSQFMDSYRDIGYQLISQTNHAYFWCQATEHQYKSGQLDKLADMLTDLNFLRGRLATVGASVVIADFYRYRTVFDDLGLTEDWRAYLDFVQTQAYYVSNPRSASTSNVEYSPWSPPSHPKATPVVFTPSGVPKGLDLMQLALGTSQDSPVFKRAVQSLLDMHSDETELPRNYWFWCNSHFAASRLMWAIPTGTAGITCLALPMEDLDRSPTSKTTYAKDNHSLRKRYLVGTENGSVLLLDATSGYKVALQQVYPVNVSIKLLSFWTNNTECLVCGADGSFTILTLPDAEKLDIDFLFDGNSSEDGSVDVDDDVFVSDHRLSVLPEFPDDDIGANVTSPRGSDGDGLMNSDIRRLSRFRLSVVPDGVSPKSGTSFRRRSTAVFPILDACFRIPSPTVLAELPQLAGSTKVKSVTQSHPSPMKVDHRNSPDSFQVHCIASTPSAELALLVGSYCSADVGTLCAFPTTDDGVIRLTAIPCLYFIQRSGNTLFLNCSRELSLPILSTDSAYANLQPGVPRQPISVAISEDEDFASIALSDGYIWIYSCSAISWVACISTEIALRYKECKNTISSYSDGDNQSLKTGSNPSCCIFLPNAGDVYKVPPNNNPSPALFAAAVNNFVLVWSIPDDSPNDESELAEFAKITQHSIPILCLAYPNSYFVLALDWCLLGDQCVLAGGTTNGHILLWRLRDGFKLLDLCAHPTSVTAVRLLPPDLLVSSGEPLLSLESAPLGVLTAASDGVIKRWNVGAACLPSPTTPLIDTSISHADLQKRSLVPMECHMPSTSLHGLWTEVMSVWFGEQGNLLVVGRRRHSSDLQFLFRPQQQLSQDNDDSHNPFNFQEVTINAKQACYWHSSKKAVTTAPDVSVAPKQSRVRHSFPATATDTTDATPASRPSHFRPSLQRHWFAEFGVNDLILGTTSAVCFWPCGRWVAVAFTTGTIQILSIHHDIHKLFGIVRRFRLVHQEPTEQFEDKPLHPDYAIQLHTWNSDSQNKENAPFSTDIALPDNTLIVVAIFASGEICMWHISGAVHDINPDNPGFVNLRPSQTWPSMHASLSDGTSDSQTVASVYPIHEQNDDRELVSSVSWSTFRSIQLEKRSVLAWITTGTDGKIFARQLSSLALDDRKCSTTGAIEDWSLNLDAHHPEAITDADVDRTGRWLITSSTDETARIWELVSGSSCFLAKHRACVRSVAFRPVMLSPLTPCAEQFFATGDDTGTLRIWSYMPNVAYGDRSRASSAEAYRSRSRTSIDSRNYRLPSPDYASPSHGQQATPIYRSQAAGGGGSWLQHIVWSREGDLVVGLSDRLCVWPFIAETDDVPKLGAVRAHLARPTRSTFKLHKCRVLRVLSTGVSDLSHTSLNLLMISPNWYVQLDKATQSQRYQLSSNNLPPTIVTVDTNTGTLYIFDPIGSLFLENIAQTN